MTLLSEQNDARNTQISKDAQRCVDLGRTLSCFECFVQDYSLVQAEVDGILRRFFTARIGMRFLLQHHIESFRRNVVMPMTQVLQRCDDVVDVV